MLQNIEGILLLTTASLATVANSLLSTERYIYPHEQHHLVLTNMTQGNMLIKHKNQFDYEINDVLID